MKHGSLFSGIGGFDLAAEWMGWENVFHCEWNEFGQKVLKHYWPQAISYADITKSDFTIHREQIDILSGGFPCQPYSQAGKRLGKEDDRHLWPEMLRAIREIQPRWVVGENVRGLTNWNGGLVFDEVQADLELEGYEVTPFLLPACAVNAPHRRDRIWFIAYSQSYGSNRASNETSRAVKGSDRIETEQPFQRGKVWPIANANGNVYPGGLDTGTVKSETAGGESENEQQAGRDQNRQRLRVESGTSSEVVTNPSSPGLPIPACREQREVFSPEGPFKGSKFSGAPAAGNGWKDFPTESPVCFGNDGFLSFMDSDAFFRELGIEHPRQPAIGFAKWRNESIKAAGNAIVPQVAYQIFKAIESYQAAS